MGNDALLVKLKAFYISVKLIPGGSTILIDIPLPYTFYALRNADP